MTNKKFFLPSSYLSGEPSRKPEHVCGESITNTSQPGLGVRLGDVTFGLIPRRTGKEELGLQ